MGKLDKFLSKANYLLASYKGEDLPDSTTGIDWEAFKYKLSMPQIAVFNSRQQINLFLAGQGSGKTHLGGGLSGFFIDNFPHVRGLIAANTYDQLNRSTLFRIREVWRTELGWKEFNEYTGEGNYVIGIQPPSHFDTTYHNFDRYNNIISFENGAVVYVGSLDNYKPLDGIEIAWAICDETKDTREEAIKEVIVGRLRQKGIYLDEDNNITSVESGNTPYMPFYVLTSPAKVDWINDWFYLNDYEDDIKLSIFSETTFFQQSVGNRFITISSTYHNADNLPSNYIANQKANLPTDLQDMLIYGSPFSKSGGEFYKNFMRDKVVCKTTYNPEIPLHISFDFNVNPYMTLGIYQIDGKTIYKLQELCLANPHNTTLGICKEFFRYYPNHDAGLFIYGDPNGKRADTRSEQGSNDYTIIMQHLDKYKPKLRLFNKAPRVAMRGNFMNLIFEDSYRGIKFLIDAGCKNTLNDYQFLKEAPDGTKLKAKVKDKTTGVQYEKYGHTSDSDEYMICKAFEQDFNHYVRGGTKKSRKGKYRKNNSR